MSLLERRRQRRAAKSRARRIGETIAGVLAALTVRWALLDAYMVPSGSMLPSLLIGDRMFVAKAAYGWRVPFTTTWLARWAAPQRGDVVVLHDPAEPARMLVKRVVGVAGDRVRWDSSRLHVNDRPLPHRPHPDGAALLASVPDDLDDDTNYTVVEETLDDRRHPIMVEPGNTDGFGETVVPPGMLLVLGDMRARSRDGRTFGPVAVDAVIGRAAVVWLSCAAPLFGEGWLCDPRTIRWDRVGRVIR